MLPYWILFGVWTLGSIQFARRTKDGRHDILLFGVAVWLTAAMIGLRWQVGTDWENYERIYENIAFQPLLTALTLSDPAYAALNWTAAQFDAGVWPANLVCGAAFMWGLAQLARRQPNPWLAIVVAVPYFIIVVAMGYTRQAASIGILCYVMSDISPNRLLRTVVLIAVAALFHKSAILTLPLIFMPIATRNFLVGAAGVVLFVILFNLILASYTDTLISTYATSNYDSQGAGIRVGMNIVAACVFLLLRNRMGFDDYEKSFWTYCALAAIVSVPALFILSASSGVDRLALFIIPLQVVTYSRTPYALGNMGRVYAPALFGIIGYSFLVQFVWLNYADNAPNWLPYKNIISADA